MANPSKFLSDGRITSLRNYTAAFTGDELFPIVAPGNATAGINYNVTASTVALNLLPILPAQNPNTVLAGPASGVATATPTFRALVPADLSLLTRNAQSTTYALATTDADKLVVLNGAGFFTLTVSTASNYANPFWCQIYNEDAGRGKTIAANGVASFILWPLQTVQLFNDNNNWKFAPNVQRWVLPSNATFFVDGSLGNDSNDGLATGTGAFLTPQQAINTVQAIDRNGNVVNIKLAAQTFSSGANATLMSVEGLTVDVGATNISGDASLPSNTVISIGVDGSGLFAADNGGYGVTISNVRFIGTTGSLGISVQQAGVVDVGSNVTFGAFGASSVHMQYAKGGFGNIVAPYAITGGAAAHLVMQSGAVLSNNNVSTVSNSPTFTTAFAQFFGCVVGNLGGANYVGTASGLKYTLSEGASVLSNGVDLNSIFPGSINGTPVISAVDYGMNYPAGVAASAGLILTSTNQTTAVFQVPNLTATSNTLATAVGITNTTAFFTGPSVAQGSTGTWLASGNVTVQSNTTSSQAFAAKLWDGATVIDSGAASIASNGGFILMSLSGILASPAGNINIAVSGNLGTAAIATNVTGAGKDSTLTVIRIG